ncbi:hypothetical protein CFIO01_12819 [Colletotrichum fioriniae PJ7]|uniref:Uncharacterized protein n=1 Tax=Colletotrichum fioriniae PJ7 TaxID=1445577 RepID=A0A010Q128_9PEZI|nr:hypothetical protein CFIO01_12819 [Colletotrichum fioriniae PJ7]
MVKTRKRSVQTVSGSFILKFERLGFAGLQEDGKWNAPSIKEPNRSGQPVPELVNGCQGDPSQAFSEEVETKATTLAVLLQVLGDPHWRAPRIQS